LVGREKEIHDITACLASARLVTLTGPGGIGKTRLAIQVVEELAEQYQDGACFVDLGSLRDPALLVQEVAAKLRMPDGAGRSSNGGNGPSMAPAAASAGESASRLVDFLRPKQLLLVLDTCEHMIEACAWLAEALLQGCPSLRILATSRQALDITGETVWRVPSLSLPDPRQWSALRRRWSPPAAAALVSADPPPDVAAALAHYEAVRLFTTRAAAASPGFTPTLRNADALIQVCRRLDGIPLAIELAAARLKVLSVEQIAERLNDRFRLLTAGGRTALPRQQTLRATMDWSHDLLSDAERVLLRRLAVFAGSFTLEAAETVCADGVDSWQLTVDSKGTGPSELSTVNGQLSTGEVLDLLSQLVDKSLVLVEQHGAMARYRLLDTTREYGQEALARSGEAEAVRQRHGAYFLARAEMARTHLEGMEQAGWLDRLEIAHDNLRVALEWWLAASDGEASLRMAGALQPFWRTRGYAAEGRRWLARALACGTARTAARAAALVGAGHLAGLQHDFAAARALVEESAAIYAEVGDRQGIAEALQHLGRIAYQENDFPAAYSLYEQSLAICREIGDQAGVAASLEKLADVTYEQGDFSRAYVLYEESLAIRQSLGDHWGIATALTGLGVVSYLQGDHTAARSFLQQSLALDRALGYPRGVAWALDNLAEVELAAGDFAAAHALFVQSLGLFRELENYPGIVDCFRGLGKTAAATGLADGASQHTQAHAPSGSKESPRAAPSPLPTAPPPSPGAAYPQLKRAARLFGAAEALCAHMDDFLSGPYRAALNASIAATRGALGEDAFAAASAEGRAARPERAIAYALEETPAL
jgi:non-specific serine/threonine protein kinase